MTHRNDAQRYWDFGGNNWRVGAEYLSSSTHTPSSEYFYPRLVDIEPTERAIHTSEGILIRCVYCNRMGPSDEYECAGCGAPT